MKNSVYFEIKTTWKQGLDQINSRLDTKAGIVLLLLTTMRYMLFSKQTKDLKLPLVCLHTNKMSRLFFFLENRYFSFTFPFLVNYSSVLRFSYKDIDIDLKMISSLISFFSDFKEGDILFDERNISDLATENESDYKDFVLIVHHLLRMEDGYIRYDHDEVNDKLEMHPLCHFDVGYYQKSTFKIGLRSRLEPQQFIDFLDKSKKTLFLESVVKRC